MSHNLRQPLRFKSLINPSVQYILDLRLMDIIVDLKLSDSNHRRLEGLPINAQNVELPFT
jgi:hypothetical protein